MKKCLLHKNILKKKKSFVNNLLEFLYLIEMNK